MYASVRSMMFKEMKQVTEWLISENPEKYDVLNAFRELKKVDWKQSTNVKEGDIVYIYLSADVKSIKLKCRVNKVDITIPDIDDAKYNIFGEYGGNAGKYMELELLEEFETDLFSKSVLEKHGFSSTQSPVRIIPEIKEYLDVVQYIFAISDLNPSDHDGSYELVNAVIKAYASMNDLSVVDYRDLNLVYLMTVGTWKHGVSAKKDTIEDSNLPKEEKQRLVELLDKLWKKAQLGGFLNQEREGVSLGLFGTGFYTFKDKTDAVSPGKFIEMCIDIQKMDDEEDIFHRCTETFTHQFRGMRAASASMVLHCLKPFVFPVFNSNMGSKNIFEYFGVEMKNKSELVYYIDNVRKVREYRDHNFKTKNYRVFDMAAWKIEVNQDDGFWPSLEEYDPNISKDDWLNFINEVEKPDHPSPMKMLVGMLELGGQASCKQLSEIYGGKPNAYIGCTANLGRRAKKYFDKIGYMEDGRERVYVLPFQGKRMVGDYGEHYVYRIRPELKAALAEIDLSEFSPYYDEGEGETEEMDALDFPKNTILYGPPGTGKTYGTVVYAVAIIEKKSIEDVKAEPYGEVFDRYNTYKGDGLVAFTTFHQSYGYEEFIEGIKPVIGDSSDGIGYKIEDGVFKAFCKRAEMPDNKIVDHKNYVFIIDEINRGNISKIFGELITLIEDTKRTGMEEEVSAVLPYSGQLFSVPSNVYILGTMNTADRSIALMDTALRRRFEFIEMMPDADVLRTIGADKVEDLDVAKMLEVINERITFLYDREHTIGHAFFTKLAKSPTVETLKAIFEKSVIPLLQEYFYEDYRKIQLVLGDNGKSDHTHKFILDRDVKEKDIFKGSIDDVIDLPEKKYMINQEAFSNIDSYKEII